MPGDADSNLNRTRHVATGSVGRNAFSVRTGEAVFPALSPGRE